MAVRNKALARGTALAQGSRTLYTVPAATVALVKHIGFTNLGPSSGAGVEVYLRSSTGTLQKVLAPSFGTANFVNESVWFALNEADQIVADVQGTDLQYWISGAELPVSQP